MMQKKWDILNGEQGVNIIIGTEEFIASNFAEYREHVEPEKPAKPVLTMSNFIVTVDGSEYDDNGSRKYYLPPDATVSISATMDGGEAINLTVLKMVGIKQVDDEDAASEIYFTGSVVGGLLTAEGKFPISTNYRFKADRNNRALDRMFDGDAPFHLAFSDLDFLA